MLDKKTWNKIVEWYQQEIRDEERDRIWHKRPLSALLLFAGAITTAWFSFFTLPFPGASVTLLGVAAATMAIVGELRGIEKAAWILLLFSFAVLELRSIKEDRNTQDAIQTDYRYNQDLQRVQQAKNFQTVVGGIQSAIKKSDEHFNETVKRTGQVLRNITGGDSFAYVVPNNLDPRDQMTGVVWNNGEQPLTGVTLTIAHTSEQPQVWGEQFYKPIFIGTIGPHAHAPIPGSEFVFAPRPGNNGEDSYWIMLSAQNGTAQETLRFRRNKLSPAFWAIQFQVSRSYDPDRPQREKIMLKADTKSRKPPRFELLLVRDWTDDMAAAIPKKH